MKQLKQLIVAALSAVMLFVFSACGSSSANALTSISVDCSTATTTFYVGDTFTYDGIVVTATYGDESTSVVENYTVDSSQFNSSAQGTYTITVSYTEDNVTQTDSYNVVVRGDNTVYYVSPDVAYSAKSSALGTEEDPYNINYLFGNSIPAAGDTVVVIPGTYVLTSTVTINVSGSYNNYITIINGSAYNSAKYSGNAVLSFYDMKFDSNNRGVQINGDYIYWYNIDVCGAGDNGMYIGGDYNIVEYCEFYNNRDTGLQLGRSYGDEDGYTTIDTWPSYNLIKNCSSYNNYDNETYGENADGFAAKLTVGYGNIFDGCISYRNSDDGWDLYAKSDTGNIGCVIIYNCVAFENGYLMETQATCNARFSAFDESFAEEDTNVYTTRDGDGNGFKLGGGSNEGDVILYNCMTFNNRMHGVTDNSNPGTLMLDGVTAYNNGVGIDSSTGAIDYTASVDTCANIDVARWDYSYNTVSNVLSVIDGAKTESDAYRGSVENSMFSNYYITDNIDADNTDSAKCGTAYGTTYTKPTSDIFTATPELTMGTSCGTYNSTTYIYSSTIHSQYRNSDGSINMGNILAVSDYSGLISSSVGCVLNKSSWDNYTHYEYTDLTKCTSADAAKAAAIKNMLYVPVNLDACYQDFDVVTHMVGVDITWSSSNDDILTVGTDIESTRSSSQSLTITVYRQSADTTVTLTASVTIGSETVTKDFVITVKAANFEVGDIVAAGVENDQLIVDQNTEMAEPAITVYDGSDYHGKTLSTEVYSVTTTYEYASSSTSSSYSTVEAFTTATAGVYKITKTVTINGADTSDSTKTGTYTYYIYVANTTTAITLSSASVTVNKDGFILEATPSNVTGTLYVYVSDTQISDITASTVMESGISTSFRTTAISLQYSNANSGAYYIYYVVVDTTGTNISSVYTSTVETVEISDVDGFNSMLKSSNSSKIYLLTADIDYEGAVPGSSSTFSALLNGMGYTVKNIAATQYVFKKVLNGTIMNIKFDNIAITSTSTKTGIISEMDGGYVYNVAMTNISVDSSNARAGALIGQIGTNGATQSITYIQNVSLVNDDEHVISATERVGGIVGFYQDNGSQSGWCSIYISNCYVDASLTVSKGAVGGIFGRYDDRNADDYLEIVNCVATGTYTSTGSSSRIAGMLGYHSGGNGTLYIENCVNLADIVFSGETLGVAIKNASGMVGNYSLAATVTVKNCYAWFIDYNTDYEVTAVSTAALKRSNWWNNTVGLDMNDTWSMVYDADGTTVIAPYVTLNFLAVS